MPRDYKLYLEDMLDAIKEIEEYVRFHVSGVL